MFAVPSSRKCAYMALIVLVVITIVRLLTAMKSSIVADDINEAHLSSFIRTIRTLNLSNGYEPHATLQQRFLALAHEDTPAYTINAHVKKALETCKYHPNPHTNHIRLPSAQILNISMVPPSDDGGNDPVKDNRYFNPAIIPLPSHLSSTPYLLVSRLVTSGLHQESHTCFADICVSATADSHSHGTRPCTASDLKLLGTRGGMRCVTKPKKVNIPPTPARRCTGNWKVFPDIPGFHDPRIFWSGRGEPLVEVNSGSIYGCVGLWLQDLRSVFPPLDEVLRKRKDKRQDESVAASDERRHNEIDLMALGAPLRYGHLTELTRNPRGSRSEVEKNWVLFFPSGDEAWVQYDIMGPVVHEKKPNDSPDAGPHLVEALNLATNTSETVASTNITDTALDDLMVQLGVKTLEEPKQSNLLRREKSMKVGDKVGDTVVASRSSEVLSATASTSLQPLASLRPPGGRLKLNGTLSNHKKHNRKSQVTTSLSIPTMATPTTSIATPSGHVKGSRSFAQLLSHGFTTPNLTHPFEPPCFDLFSHRHTHDVRDNTGHWHQGSNSLRLTLCTRQQFRSRTCLPTSSDNGTDQKSLGPDEYEKLMISESAVVHFSIIHRKFTNDWKLPMRYERYFLVWEAKVPFRILGLSRWPVLFGGERARPWTMDEDVGYDVATARHDSSPETIRGLSRPANEDRSGSLPYTDAGDSAYFTYSPSIAYAWRPRDEDHDAHRQRGHEDLGTGYLNDEIIVGIGMDDVRQGFVRMQVEDVLGCLRLCDEEGNGTVVHSA